MTVVVDHQGRCRRGTSYGRRAEQQAGLELDCSVAYNHRLLHKQAVTGGIGVDQASQNRPLQIRRQRQTTSPQNRVAGQSTDVPPWLCAGRGQ